MNISESTRELVRKRARYACEYCELHEDNVGGRFTIDHYHPQSKGGSDDVENLVYCCFWCNQRKLDYWAERSSDPQIWNPRRSASYEHFIVLEDGLLHPLNENGAFTIRRLDLNRPALIAWRLRQTFQNEQERLLTQYRNLLQIQTQAMTELTALLEEQQTLIREQQILLNRLVGFTRK